MNEPRPADGFGHVTTVFGAKGGCGKTTLATNLAVVLADGGARSVCLVDLDLVYGDVATVLDVEPKRTMADAVRGDGGFDRDALTSILTPLGMGIDAVLAPVAPGAAELITPVLVGELLASLAMCYDHVVVDTSGPLGPNMLAALDSSDRHVLLTGPERPALRHLRFLLDMLDLLPYRDRARSIVVNRCDSTVGFDAADIERAINRPVAAALPSSWDVRAAVNDAVPLAAAKPGNPYSVAVRRLVTERPTASGSVAPRGRDSR